MNRFSRVKLWRLIFCTTRKSLFIVVLLILATSFTFLVINRIFLLKLIIERIDRIENQYKNRPFECLDWLRFNQKLMKEEERLSGISCLNISHDRNLKDRDKNNLSRPELSRDRRISLKNLHIVRIFPKNGLGLLIKQSNNNTWQQLSKVSLLNSTLFPEFVKTLESFQVNDPNVFLLVHHGAIYEECGNLFIEYAKKRISRKILIKKTDVIKMNIDPKCKEIVSDEKIFIRDISLESYIPEWLNRTEEYVFKIKNFLNERVGNDRKKRDTFEMSDGRYNPDFSPFFKNESEEFGIENKYLFKHKEIIKKQKFILTNISKALTMKIDEFKKIQNSTKLKIDKYFEIYADFTCKLSYLLKRFETQDALLRLQMEYINDMNNIFTDILQNRLTPKTFLPEELNNLIESDRWFEHSLYKQNPNSFYELVSAELTDEYDAESVKFIMHVPLVLQQFKLLCLHNLGIKLGNYYRHYKLPDYITVLGDNILSVHLKRCTQVKNSNKNDFICAPEFVLANDEVINCINDPLNCSIYLMENSSEKIRYAELQTGLAVSTGGVCKFVEQKIKEQEEIEESKDEYYKVESELSINSSQNIFYFAKSAQFRQTVTCSYKENENIINKSIRLEPFSDEINIFYSYAPMHFQNLQARYEYLLTYYRDTNTTIDEQILISMNKFNFALMCMKYFHPIKLELSLPQWLTDILDFLKTIWEVLNSADTVLITAVVSGGLILLGILLLILKSVINYYSNSSSANYEIKERYWKIREWQ